MNCPQIWVKQLNIRGIIQMECVILRGLIKGWAPGKLTGCDLTINLPGCFHLLFLLSFIRKTKNARLKNPTDLVHKKIYETLKY